MRSTFTLGTHLHYLIIFAGGSYHSFAFDYIHANWFLHVYVRACFHCIDSLQRMPVIGRADEDNIELIFGQHLAVVAVEFGSHFRLLSLAYKLSSTFEQV